MVTIPSFDREMALRNLGYVTVAGVDEVGRGPLAGPVLAGVVVLPDEVGVLGSGLVRDSKLLTFRQLEKAYSVLVQEAKDWSVGVASHEEIDDLGIAPASRLAMARAVKNLKITPDFLLVDAFRIPEIKIPQENIVHGDRVCLSISAASVIAKIERDEIMREQDHLYPEYGFARHKGYPTKEHLARLQEFGPSVIHRLSFAPVRHVLGRS